MWSGTVRPRRRGMAWLDTRLVQAMSGRTAFGTAAAASGSVLPAAGCVHPTPAPFGSPARGGRKAAAGDSAAATGASSISPERAPVSFRYFPDGAATSETIQFPPGSESPGTILSVLLRSRD